MGSWPACVERRTGDYLQSHIWMSASRTHPPTAVSDDARPGHLGSPERGTVDIETLRKVNDDLITTIDEALRIQQEGHAKCAEVEKELVVLEDDLREKATAIAAG